MSDHQHQHSADEHQHGHGHGHGHGHSGAFDWDAMADRLELDAAITEPIVRAVIGELFDADPQSVHRVLDAGCGPGVVACTLAELLPRATITAMDSTPQLLERVRRRAAERGLGERVLTLDGDLDHDLPRLDPVDLVWAGMVLHHVADAVPTLQRLLGVLVPGGTLVMTEFGDVPSVLPDGDPLLVDGTWPRFQAATTAALNERLGLDPVAIDWPSRLTEAGFRDVHDAGRTAVHAAPLSPTALAWLAPHVRSGIAMAGDRIDARDAAALTEFADHLATRDDLSVTTARRVLVARR